MAKRWLLVLVVIAGMASAGARAEENPEQVVQAFCSQLLDVMKNAKQLGFQGRVRKLTPAVEQAYDMPDMTRNAIGASAARVPADQMAKLTQAFTRFTVANYADQFDGWSGERFQVDAPHTAPGNGSVVVPSKIVPKTGQPTEIDYVMHKDPSGAWKITDVLLDGTVSQLAVRRSEFSSIVRRDGAPGLTQVLEHKADQLASKPG